MIELLSSGTLSTVQDLGRLSYLRFGVGTSGAMDRLALQAGNLMLGNPATAKCRFYPFRYGSSRMLIFQLPAQTRQQTWTVLSYPSGGRAAPAPGKY